jgi:hypothetical protein
LKDTDKKKQHNTRINSELEFGGRGVLSTRAYFSTHHLWAAEHFSKLAAEIEDHHTGRPKFNLEHRIYVINSILSAVAFLEAAVNELYQDAHDDHQSYIKTLDSKVIEDMATFWAKKELKGKFVSILNKYKNALRIAGQKEFDEDQSLYQNAELVIDLRNFLTHYKPKSVGGDSKHDIQDKLKGKFPPNKIYEQSGNPDFPDKMLSKGCAEWSFLSVKNFADDFFARMSIEPNYQKVDMHKLGDKE